MTTMTTMISNHLQIESNSYMPGNERMSPARNLETEIKHHGYIETKIRRGENHHPTTSEKQIVQKRLMRVPVWISSCHRPHACLVKKERKNCTEPPIPPANQTIETKKNIHKLYTQRWQQKKRSMQQKNETKTSGLPLVIRSLPQHRPSF